MQLNINRFSNHIDHGAFGELKVYEDTSIVYKSFTVERPWLDNKPYVSCIPAYDGYILEPYNSPKFGKTYAIVGDTVGMYEGDQGCSRFACLFHSANLAQQLHGCIAPGTRLGALDNNWAVLRSGPKTDELIDLLYSAPGTHTLSIRWDKLLTI